MHKYLNNVMVVISIKKHRGTIDNFPFIFVNLTNKLIGYNYLNWGELFSNRINENDDVLEFEQYVSNSNIAKIECMKF